MFLLKIRNSRKARILSCFLAINILAEIISPSVAMALTSGPSQPEVQSFEPVNTSDMVDLFTGDFKYNIPLMDVGGYPLNINYNSGVGMDQEATWVGLGWNLNVGAITRNMRGLPDDFNGVDQIEKEFNMKDNVSYGGNVKVGFEIFGWGKVGSGGSHANSGTLSVGLAIDYNNYTGIGVTQSAGVSLGMTAGEGSKGSMNASLGMTSSAKDGLDLNQSVSFSANINNKEKGDNNTTSPSSSSMSAGVSMGVNSRSGLKTLGFNASLSNSETKKNAKGKSYSGDHSGSVGSSGTVNFGVSTYVPTIHFPMTTNAVALSFKLGTTIFGADGSIDVGGFYSNQHVSTKHMTLPAYGYLHSEAGQANENALMDFNREKDGAYNRNMQKLPVTNYTYDVYSIAGQGIGGTYRPFRHDIGYVFDNTARTTSDSYTLGGEVDAAETVHAGIDISVVDVNTTVGPWTSQNLAKDKLSFKNSSGALDETYAFKEVGEKSVDDDAGLFAEIGRFDPVRVKLSGVALGAHADDALEGNYASGGVTPSTPITQNTRSARHKRNQVISTLNYAEARHFGLQKDIYTSGVSGAKDHHIAEISVLKTDGSRYVYGLPAYNLMQKEYTFNVTGNSQVMADKDYMFGTVNYSAADASTGNTKGIDNYYNRVTTPSYAHSYMLTAVVSPDYVDLTGDGPSKDDLGNYTKFSYERVSDYDWRTPIGAGKANFNENTKSANVGDDQANYVYGSRDMHYVSTIESKNYIAIFETGDREDAQGVLENGGPSGDKSKLLKNISLYSKPEYDKQVASGGAYHAVPIKVANFVYDYELCQHVLNNPSSLPLSGDNYSTTTNQHGKLTLKQIYFTYGTSNKAKLNSYHFEYNAARNPNYDPKAYDRWGNYKPNPVLTTSTASNLEATGSILPNWEYPYTNPATQANADDYSASWSLSKITLPSGAEINVCYESDDYAFVQNLPAMNMCKAVQLLNLSGGHTPVESDISSVSTQSLMTVTSAIPPAFDNYNTIILELPKPIPTSVVGSDPLAYFKENILKDMLAGRFMYFRFLVNMTKQGFSSMSHNYGDYFEYVSGYAQLKNDNFGLVAPTGSDYRYCYVTLATVPVSKTITTPVNPIAKAAWQTGRTNFPSLVWDASFDPAGGPADVVKAMINSDFTKNIIDGIIGPNLAIAVKGYGMETIMNKSWVRLYNAEGKKYGGGCRVKALTINDNWDDMTNTGSGSQPDFTYGQTYEYTTVENGRTISSGVAAYEPMIGGDEIPQRLPNYYTNQGNNPEAVNFLIPSDQFFTEEPYGESFFPSPSVGYSKIKVANLARTGVSSHATGYVLHKFYTARDYPTITERTLIDKKTFKPPFGGLTKIFARDYMTVTQGHVIKVNDMHGKERGMEVYAENKPDEPISTIEYRYKTQGPNGYVDPVAGDISKDARYKGNVLDNTCTTIRPDGSLSSAQIGVDYDMVADFRESKTTTVMGGAQINLSVFLVGVFPGTVPTIWPDFSRDVSRFRSAVTTKIVDQYGLLDETIATDLGSKVQTNNLAYDSETGEVLLTKTQNDFEDQVYSFTYPAHWSYDLMGPAYKNIGATVASAAFSGGTASGVLGAGGIFTEGDEISIGAATKAWVCSVGATSVGAIDADGHPITASGPVKILRSGRRNQQSAPVGSVISLVNPIDIDDDGVLNTQLSFGTTSANSRVIKTSAVEYSSQWQMYPGYSDSNPAGCSCALSQQGADLYNVMRNLFTAGLLMTPTPELLYSAGSHALYHDFTANLVLDDDCVNDPTLASPTHDQYWQYHTGPGANQVQFTMSNTAGESPCSDVCPIIATIPGSYGLNWADITLTGLTGPAVMTNTSSCNGSMVIAATYTVNSGEDKGATHNFYFTIDPGKCYSMVNCSATAAASVTCSPNVGDLVNPYQAGIKGNWRMLRSWSYLSDRTQTLTGTSPTKNPDIRKDGMLLTKDPTTGAALEFKPFWKYAGGRFAENPTYWTFTSQVTKYSPGGLELENKDALSRYSSAIYGYNESLPLAVGSNCMLQEMAYDGFEDYDFINAADCKKKHFNFYESKAKLSSTESHTGNYSIKLLATEAVKASRKLPVTCTPGTLPPNCAYLLGCYDFLPLFSPTPKKYVLSYWVKEKSTATYFPVSPVLTYGYSNVTVSVTSAGPLTLGQVVKSSIIDGWQRVECTFDVPAGATGSIDITLKNASGVHAVESYFDDIRIHPFDGNLKSFVYDPVTLKYVAELDANNFATFFEYNEEGGLIRIKKETEKGIMTIQETKNHTKQN